MQINLTVGTDKNLVVSGNNLIAGYLAVSVPFTVQRLNQYSVKLFWDSSDDTDQKWVYLDGERVSTTPAIDADGYEYVTVRLSAERTGAFEGLSSPSAPGSSEVLPNYLPVINWKSSIDAFRYYIYIDGALIRVVVADGTKYNNKLQTVTHLTDGWHYLVVQARDKAGNQENSVTKWFRVWTPGAPVEDISVSAGSGAGLYDITIGV